MIMGGKINTCSKSSEKQQNGDICGKGTLYCINPPLLAEAIAQLHLNSSKSNGKVTLMHYGQPASRMIGPCATPFYTWQRMEWFESRSFLCCWM